MQQSILDLILSLAALAGVAGGVSAFFMLALAALMNWEN
mgnify:CR=1 FL=1